MDTQKITEINGRQLYESFLSGAQKIFDHQIHLNKINVFPVADADTGTNLASTMRSMVDSIIPTDNLKGTAVALADAALVGARGNSGIIFAQFLYGFSNEIQGIDKLDIRDFAVAAKNAVKYAYEAIANPVEGTMISVIKDWAEYLYKLKETFEDFLQMLLISLEKASESLKETTSKLSNLAKANVVDAGAKGFVVFLEGMVDFFKTGALSKPSLLKQVAIEADEHVVHHEDITFRYCTEAMLQGRLNKSKIKDSISDLGDSMVIAGSENRIRVHIHTDEPWTLFERISHFGDITFQKVDDMVMQNDIASEPRHKTALLTDSTCDLPVELINKYQINVVPLSVHFGNTYFLDRITIQPKQFYKRLVESKIYPTTAQPAAKDFINKYNYLSTHYDSVISMHISSNMSGTWQNSKTAAQRLIEDKKLKVDVLDTKRLTASLGLEVLRAAQSLDEGMNHEELVEQMKNWPEKNMLWVTSKTLKYMVKSGRVSATRGMIGKLLGLKPIVKMNPEGRADTFGKPFTEKQSMRKVMHDVRKFIGNKVVWNYAISHASNAEAALWYANEMEGLTGKKPAFIQDASPVLVTHVGPGVVGLAVMLE